MPQARKIRGHRRHWRTIDRWVAENQRLDLPGLEHSHHQVARLRVTPWGWSSWAKTEYGIKEPHGKTKLRILRGLLSIYTSWSRDLEGYPAPYYLKMWLYEPHFSESQVVCALGDRIEHYEKVFAAPPEGQTKPLPGYGSLDVQLDRLSWRHCLEETYLTNNDPGDPAMYASRKHYEEDRAYIGRLLQRPHRTEPGTDVNGHPCRVYCIPVGDIWVGTGT
ncbi:hypothetical protein [Lewinella sp. IMCC34191]|uniref:hypothetical protein n=1 Tax=Lewinella sp. IMCC34191 TaxID=2259172 RepID=UPI000E26CE88|nr:hypothetical protein [Lewinella sp. IMCC34191]